MFQFLFLRSGLGNSQIVRKSWNDFFRNSRYCHVTAALFYNIGPGADKENIEKKDIEKGLLSGPFRSQILWAATLDRINLDLMTGC